MDALYFGARPKPSLTRMLDKAGYRTIYAHYKKGILSSMSTCSAVVLHWKFDGDQQVIEEARATGLPVMVITANLDAAYANRDMLADLYLEEPARDEDIAALLVDLISMEQPSPRVTEINNRHMKRAA